jgi:hypothetical protein
MDASFKIPEQLRFKIQEHKEIKWTFPLFLNRSPRLYFENYTFQVELFIELH